MNLVFTACSNDDNPSSDSSGGKEYTGIPLIILDTDIGSSTDDLFAMQMLYTTAASLEMSDEPNRFIRHFE
ncbi:MAG: hypothetical protein E7107_11230 [Prevotella sp.]|nr:hypothetical protein [Prevotella sp.]